MITRWCISNFKPIANRAELTLAPLTVLAGLNSSGKSSLIQSILMISQTLASPVIDRPLMPNGPIVQLGTFAGILNASSQSSTMMIGFELTFTSEEPRTRPARRTATIGSVNVSATFDSTKAPGQPRSALEASKLAVANVDLGVTSQIYVSGPPFPIQDDNPKAVDTAFTFRVRQTGEQELANYLTNVAPDYRRLVPYTDQTTAFLGTIDIPSLMRDKDKAPILPYLVSFSHFLPSRLFRKYHEGKRRVQQLDIVTRYLVGSPYLLFNDRISTRYANLLDLDAALPYDLRSSIAELLSNVHPPQVFSGDTLRDLGTWLNSLKQKERRPISNRLRKLIVQHFSQDSSGPDSGRMADSEGLESVTNDIYADTLLQSVEQITRFFTSSIRYLGPLRADPQAAQRFAPSSELDDVGAKGEYAAAVYDANQTAQVDWYNPVSATVERGILRNALDGWSRYLGVANQITIEAAGQSGVSWQVVHRTGHNPLPLTAVGVGVSQILPILVMGLLAPQGTVLIVEQPELHLHPRVQSLLGDFFIGLSKCKKQCLIETHSENLVSQLRYHMVSEGSDMAGQCQIYFVAQDDVGETTFDSIEISPQGNILNWPEGFFDEGMIQESRITDASVRKRAASSRG